MSDHMSIKVMGTQMKSMSMIRLNLSGLKWKNKNLFTLTHKCGVPQGPWWMGGAQPRRMTVISPAIGPVWAVHLMDPSLPTAALPRPWWLLQTRQATAWRALASAREVGVWRPAPHCLTGASTSGRWLFLSALILPLVVHWLMFSSIMLAWDFPSVVPRLCMAPVVHGWTADVSLFSILTLLLYNSSGFAIWLLWFLWVIIGWYFILANFYRPECFSPNERLCFQPGFGIWLITSTFPDDRISSTV